MLLVKNPKDQDKLCFSPRYHFHKFEQQKKDRYLNVVDKFLLYL